VREFEKKYPGCHYDGRIVHGLLRYDWITYCMMREFNGDPYCATHEWQANKLLRLRTDLLMLRGASQELYDTLAAKIGEDYDISEPDELVLIWNMAVLPDMRRCEHGHMARGILFCQSGRGRGSRPVVAVGECVAGLHCVAGHDMRTRSHVKYKDGGATVHDSSDCIVMSPELNVIGMSRTYLGGTGIFPLVTATVLEEAPRSSAG